jgi:hypothetical protein
MTQESQDPVSKDILVCTLFAHRIVPRPSKHIRTLVSFALFVKDAQSRLSFSAHPLLPLFTSRSFYGTDV